jgi:hypothetical protein
MGRLGAGLGESAEVLAIGPFHPSLAGHLVYDAMYYATVPVGAVVVAQLFTTSWDRGEVADLAAILGFDPTDPSTHALDPWRADLDLLYASELSYDAERFVALRAVGFAFHFSSHDATSQ